MTSKNPFEIRLDILRMAQEMMDRELDISAQKYHQKIEATRQNNIGALGGVVEEAPKMYTPDEVVSKAATLYNFVSDASSSSSLGTTRSTRDDPKHRK